MSVVTYRIEMVCPKCKRTFTLGSVSKLGSVACHRGHESTPMAVASKVEER